MIEYLINQCLMGNLTYEYMVTKRPDLKDDLDKYIIEHNLQDSIDGWYEINPTEN